MSKKEKRRRDELVINVQEIYALSQDKDEICHHYTQVFSKSNRNFKRKMNKGDFTLRELEELLEYSEGMDL